MLLYQVIDAFDNAKLNYVIVGGYALALHGIVRATMDIDIVLSLNLRDFELAESTLKQIGLQSRLPVRAKDIISMRNEYIKNRNLIAWSFVDYKNPSRQLDIIIINDIKDFTIEKISLAGRKINIVSLKDLMKMKQKAGRPQDLVDVQSIKDKLNEK